MIVGLKIFAILCGLIFLGRSMTNEKFKSRWGIRSFSTGLAGYILAVALPLAWFCIVLLLAIRGEGSDFANYLFRLSYTAAQMSVVIGFIVSVMSALTEKGHDYPKRVFIWAIIYGLFWALAAYTRSVTQY